MSWRAAARTVVAACGLVASAGVVWFTYQNLFGCASSAKRVESPLPIQSVPPQMLDLTVFVETDDVKLNEARAAVRTGLNGAILRAGMRPTSDAINADLTIRAKGTSDPLPNASVLFEVVHRGALIGQSQSVCAVAKEGCNWGWGKWGDCIAVALVNDLAHNQRALEVALARGGRTPSPQAQVQVIAPVAPAPSTPPPATRPVTSPTWITGIPQPDAWALVVGIERYRDVPAATGARGDAEQMAALVRQTLGVPEAHVVTAFDDRASRSDVEKHLRWLRSNVQPGARVYFYFSGHGAPDPSTGASYIVPYDGDPRFLTDTALPMKDVIKSLSDTGAREVLAIVDSCFSGAGGRSVLPPGARPLVMQKEVKPAARVALLSASSGAEISGPTADQRGGLFTQVLLQAIGTGKADLDGDGQISLRELLDWVKPRVARDARRDNRDQHPNLVVGDDVGDGTFMVVRGLSGN